MAEAGVCPTRAAPSIQTPFERTSRSTLVARSEHAADPIPSNNLTSMPAYAFEPVYEDAGDGWVFAHVRGLPEVQTQGETLEQAREMVLDAIALVLEEPPPISTSRSVSDER